MGEKTYAERTMNNKKYSKLDIKEKQSPAM